MACHYFSEVRVTVYASVSANRQHRKVDMGQIISRDVARETALLSLVCLVIFTLLVPTKTELENKEKALTSFPVRSIEEHVEKVVAFVD